MQSVATVKNIKAENIADYAFLFFLISEFLFSHTIINQLGIVFFAVSVFALLLDRDRVHYNYYFTYTVLLVMYFLYTSLFGISINPQTSISLVRTLVVNSIVLFLVYNYLALRSNILHTMRLYLSATLVFTIVVFIISLPGLFSNRLGVKLSFSIITIDVNSNNLGIAAAVSALMCFFMLLDKRRTQDLLRMLWYGLIILLSGSRKAILMFGLGVMLLVYLMYPRQRLRNILIIITLLTVLLLLIMSIPVLYDIIGTRVEAMISFASGKGYGDGSLKTRSSFIDTGWKYIQQRPWLGYGLDCFRHLPGSFGTYSHNNYVELLVSGGIFGLVLYYLPIVFTLLHYMLIRKKNIMQALFLTLLLMIMIMDYAMVSYYERPMLLLMMFILQAQPRSYISKEMLLRLMNRIARTIVKIWRSKAVQSFIPARLYCKWEYKRKMGKVFDLKNPKTLNEKLQWIKLYDKNPLFVKLADKYEVREYIKEKIGDKYLVPLIGVYNSVEEIPFDELPQEYVLKCTHDSGTVIVKNAGNPISVDEIKDKLRKGLKRNYYYEHREWWYRYIKPRIICEELIKTEDGGPPRDYKLFCFDGEPKFFFVASDRGRGTKFDFFDMDWNKYPVCQHYPNSNYNIKRPDNWDEIVECARKLSEGLKHVRTDFYVDADGKIFVGEMTLCHFSGIEKFDPEEYDEYFGKFLNLK